MTYVNRDTITAIGIVFPCLALIVFAVRVHTQRRYSEKIEVDAVLAGPACVLTIGTGIAMVIGAQLRILSEQTTVKTSSEVGKFEYAFWPVHTWAMGTIKLSILFFFRRVFKGRAYRTPFDYANWALILLTALWTVLFSLTQIFACGKDPSAAWRSLQSLRNECIDSFTMMSICGIVSWFMDLAILLEPLMVIKTLKMNTKRKLQASVIFFCSIFAVVAGLLRMIILLQIMVQGTAHPTIKILGTTLNSKDSVGVVSILLFWTYVEIGVGFAVACLLPSARVLEKLSVQPIIRKVRSFVSLKSLLYSKQGSPTIPEAHMNGSGEISSEAWEKLKHLRDEYQMTNISDRGEPV